MRKAHEGLLIAAVVFLAVSGVTWGLSLLLGAPCLVASFVLGFALIRRAGGLGALAVRTHLSFFIAAAIVAGVMGPVVHALVFPGALDTGYGGDAVPLSVANAAWFLLACYAVAFALGPTRSWLSAAVPVATFVAPAFVMVSMWMGLPGAVVGSADAGRATIVRFLLRAGADIEARNRVGQTALIAAVDHPETVALLLAHGADPNARDNGGATALSNAIWADASDSIRILLEGGARPMVEAGGGYTPLSIAAAKGRIDLMSLLLENGAELDYVSSEGRTALWDAVEAHEVEAVRFLMERGADPDQAVRGQRPIERARELERPKLVEVLERRAAD